MFWPLFAKFNFPILLPFGLNFIFLFVGFNLPRSYFPPPSSHSMLFLAFSFLDLSFLASFSFVVFPQFWNFIYSIIYRIHTVKCLCEFNFLWPYSSHYSLHPLFSLKFNIFRSSLSWPSWKSMDALGFNFLESALRWLSFCASVLDLTIFLSYLWSYQLCSFRNPTFVKISSSLVHICTNDFFFRFHFIHTFLQIQLS